MTMCLPLVSLTLGLTLVFPVASAAQQTAKTSNTVNASVQTDAARRQLDADLAERDWVDQQLQSMAVTYYSSAGDIVEPLFDWLVKPSIGLIGGEGPGPGWLSANGPALPGSIFSFFYTGKEAWNAYKDGDNQNALSNGYDAVSGLALSFAPGDGALSFVHDSSKAAATESDATKFLNAISFYPDPNDQHALIVRLGELNQEISNLEQQIPDPTNSVNNNPSPQPQAPVSISVQVESQSNPAALAGSGLVMGPPTTGQAVSAKGETEPGAPPPSTSGVTIVEPPGPPGGSGYIIPMPDNGSNVVPSGAAPNSAPPSAPLGQQIQGLEQAIGARLTGPSKLQPLPVPSIQVDGSYYSDDGGNTWKLIPSSDVNGSVPPTAPNGSLDFIPSGDTVPPGDLASQIGELRAKAAQADQNLQQAQELLQALQSSSSAQAIQGSPKNYSCQSGPCTLEQWEQESVSFPSPKNYPCQNGPCTLEQWQAEPLFFPSPRNYTCSWGPCTLEEWQNGQGNQKPSQTVPQQAPVRGPCLYFADGEIDCAGDHPQSSNQKPKQPPSQSGKGPTQNPQPPPGSQGLCPAGYTVNPAALACLKSLDPFCDHVGGDPNGSYIPWCITAGGK